MARMTVARLVEQLRVESFRLAQIHALEADRTLRTQIADAVDGVCRNVAEALTCDQGRQSARLIRRARSSLTEVQDGLRRSVSRRYVSDVDVKPAQEALSKLYPALSCLLTHCGEPAHRLE